MTRRTITAHLVRHGETYFNRYNKLQGWSNSPLTERGLHQASETGAALAETRYAAAYCSDTTRAEQTARLILAMNRAGSPREPVSLPALRENFFGSFEGTSSLWAWSQAAGPHGLGGLGDVIREHSIATARDWLKEADPFHDAESDREFWERLEGGYGQILADERVADGDTVLVISHATTLRSIAERFGHGRFDVTRKPRNGGLTTVLLSAAPSRPSGGAAPAIELVDYDV